MKRTLILGSLVLGTALLASPALAHCGTCEADKKPADIVDTAIAAGQFKTLAAALTAADLVETLKGKGPFTVFAPTDKAFAKLPEGTVASLLEERNRAKLTAVLTYHVVPGNILAKDAAAAGKAKTVQGQEIVIKIIDGQLYVNDARVIKTDIVAGNGVIHVIDSVILPPTKP
jgi:uncharacterized surface protein with fasciclin (FAS1) repeats